MTLKEKWIQICDQLAGQFSDGEEIGVEGILFLIGVQELGLGIKTFTKSEKEDIMHIALCSILVPFGYYEYTARDADGWPHFKNVKKLPSLKRGEQSRLMKEAIIFYFDKD